jgi:hypothetical protein
MSSERPEVDLVTEELRDQVDELIDGDPSAPFGLYAGVRGSVVGDVARALEQQVFLEAFGDTPEVLAQEYGRYEQASIFYCVIDHRARQPAGMARCIVPSSAGLKSLDDIARDWGQDLDAVLTRTGIDLDPEEAWDCATIATLAPYRRGSVNGAVTSSLYQAVAATPFRLRYRWWLSILDLPVYRLIQWKLARPFSTYDGVEAGPYLGSVASLPVWSDIDEWSARVRREDPARFELIFGGRGIDGTVSPLDWDLVDDIVRASGRVGLPTRYAEDARTA